MIVRVDPDAALPVYEQIRNQIQRMAAVGTLPVGARLPTIRQLAADLGLAKGTVSKAYELLEHDRVVEARGRRGTFIVEVTPTQGAAEQVSQRQQLADAAESYAIIARQLGVDGERAHDALDQALRELA